MKTTLSSRNVLTFGLAIVFAVAEIATVAVAYL
jgi:hypothetical protein